MVETFNTNTSIHQDAQVVIMADTTLNLALGARAPIASAVSMFRAGMPAVLPRIQFPVVGREKSTIGHAPAGHPTDAEGDSECGQYWIGCDQPHRVRVAQ